MAKNIRDFFYFLIGIFQARKLLKQLRPAVIFVKGGFVGVPVGLAAANLHIPYVTHDSDAIPGLANRIIARWAKLHAVALPAELYPYPPEKTVTTGIPLTQHFEPVTPRLKRHYRQLLKLPEKAKVLFVIGGGLGAQGVNYAVAEAVPHLLLEYPDLYVMHGVGRANFTDMKAVYDQSLTEAQRQRVEIFDFISDVYRYSGAADIVVTRAGATNLAEFAVQGKACIVIPASFLTGGQQLKNARYLAEQGAAVVINETELTADSNRLARQVSELFKNPEQQIELGKKLHEFAQPDATAKLADILLEQAQTQQRSAD